VLGARYGIDIWGRHGAELEPFIGQGLLLKEGSRIRLSRRGMLLAHEVMAIFV
jgi:coproporphyrinogen III oxidase-like Fe-S oxidoreductase